MGFNILWLVVFGWGLFLVHVAAGIALCVTMIGIPFRIQLFKLSVLALWPFGRRVVDAGTSASGSFAVPADPIRR